MAAAGLALDQRAGTRRETRRERDRFERVKRAEAAYARELRKVARIIDELVRKLAPVVDLPAVEAALLSYTHLIEPWAKATAERMLADVARRDEREWAKLARGMSRALRMEVREAPTGAALLRLMADQVRLIKSLPTEAAERVHELALRGLETGGRAKELSDEIMRTGHVTRSRANLIARTETARAASTLLQARAEHVGSEAYVWETARDSDVRPEHRELQGKLIRWDQPPIAGPNGMRYHAGQGPNCRCYPRPVLPEEIA